MTAISRKVGGEGLPEGFLETARSIYADDPMWIPEDSEEVTWAFSPGNPWFANNAAVALCAPGKARVAGFKDCAARIDGEEVAFFGYFETTGVDQQIERALFDEVIYWAKGLGAKALFGPIDFSTYSRNRLRIGAEPGALTHQGEPYNPDFYPAVLERLGFRPYWLYVTQIIDFSEIKPLLDRDAERVVALEKQGFRFELLDSRLWNEHLPKIHRLADAVFGNNLAYTPLPWSVFRRYCGESLIKSACKTTSILCWDPNGEIAGFFLNYPHYGKLVTAGAGSQRVAVHHLDFDVHAPRLDSGSSRVLLGKTLGVAPQFRGQGIMRAVISNSLSRMENHYDRLFGTLIRVGNWSERYLGFLDLPQRRYALYHLDLR